MKVLVTDADQKHALAAVRALGKEKIVVHAGSTPVTPYLFFPLLSKEGYLS